VLRTVCSVLRGREGVGVPSNACSVLRGSDAAECELDSWWRGDDERWAGECEGVRLGEPCGE
jgi:hypothetical protein